MGKASMMEEQTCGKETWQKLREKKKKGERDKERQRQKGKRKKEIKINPPDLPPFFISISTPGLDFQPFEVV